MSAKSSRLKWLLASGDHEAAKLHICPACPPYISLRDVARAYVQRDPVSIAKTVVPDPEQLLAVCDVRACKRASHTVTAQNARSVLAAIAEADGDVYVDGEFDAAFVMAADALMHASSGCCRIHMRCASELALDVALKKPTHVRLVVPYKTIRNVDEFVAAQRSCTRIYVFRRSRLDRLSIYFCVGSKALRDRMRPRAIELVYVDSSVPGHQKRDGVRTAPSKCVPYRQAARCFGRRVRDDVHDQPGRVARCGAVLGHDVQRGQRWLFSIFAREYRITSATVHTPF